MDELSPAPQPPTTRLPQPVETAGLTPALIILKTESLSCVIESGDSQSDTLEMVEGRWTVDR